MKTKPNDAQVMMTLSAIAYAGWEFEICHELKHKQYATQNQWNLVWGPHDSPNLAYRAFVVQNTVNTNRYAVVIRGSVLSVTNPLGTVVDWFRNLQVGTLVPFGSDASQGSVAKGTAAALADLLDLPCIGRQPKLSSFLISLGSDAEINVTGHSLGGAQAAVLAAWVGANCPNPANINTYTFAAPTPGDSAFATYLASVADVHRYWNEWDVIPRAFEATGLAEIAGWYPPPGPSQTAANELLVAVLQGLPPSPNPYVPAGGGGTMLPNNLTPASSFLTEVGDQHDHNLYLKLLDLDYEING